MSPASTLLELLPFWASSDSWQRPSGPCATGRTLAALPSRGSAASLASFLCHKEGLTHPFLRLSLRLFVLSDLHVGSPPLRRLPGSPQLKVGSVSIYKGLFICQPLLQAEPYELPYSILTENPLN